MSNRSVIKAGAVGVAMLCSLQAGAQDNRLESIVVTAERQQSAVRDLASSVYRVSPEDLDTVQHTHINEALARVPGTWISRGNGQEHLTAIRSPVLTGAGSCGAFQMSQDGIPLHGVGFCNVNQLFEAHTEQAGGIEVIRGPGSILFGANALHGAINVLTPQVNDEAGASVALERGSWDYWRGRASLNASQDRHGLRLDANATSDGGFKDDAGYDQQKFTLRHEYSGSGLSISNVLSGSNLNQETAGYLEGYKGYEDGERKDDNPNPEAFRDVGSIRFHSRIQWDTGSGSWTLTPYLRRMEMDFLQHFLPGIPLEQNGHDSIGLQSMYSSTWGDTLQWMAGMDLERSEGYLKETQEVEADPGNAFLNETLPLGRHYDYEVESRMLSPYAQLRWQWDAANQLNLGLRYEWLEYDYDNKMAAGRLREDGTACGFGGCRYARPADRSDDFDNISAQLGWIHDFSEDRQVYMNLSRAFRAPETSELYRLQNDQLVADLESEEMHAIEAGYRASVGRGNYSLAAYYMEKDNVIFQDSNRNNVSDGQTEHAGLEFDMALALTDSLSWNLAASYARHTYVSDISPRGVTVNIDGNEIDTSPRWTGSSQLNWQISEGQELEAEWVHMGSYYVDEANEHSYGGHDLINLRYQADLAGEWFMALRVTNLLDEDYAERADYAFGNYRYFVGQPRAYYLTLGASF